MAIKNSTAITYTLLTVSAVLELTGCWLMIHYMQSSDRDILHLVLAIVILVVFALSLGLHPISTGRLFAIYGGIYILGSLVLLIFSQDYEFMLRDVVGALLLFTGTYLLIR